MVHSGYEASGVDYTFSSLKGLLVTAKSMLFAKNEDEEALRMLNEPAKPVHSYNPLVQIDSSNSANLEETRA
jgi:hypothetical protein